MSNLFDNLDEDEPVAPKPPVAPSPFEALFNIEPGSTPIASTMPSDAWTTSGGNLVDPSTGEIVEQLADATSAAIDKEERLEDLKIQAQMDTIHGAAMGAFNQQQALAQQVDPKFSARNSEVAAQFLTIALSSVAARADVKNKREKLRLAKATPQGPTSVHQNLIVANRNDILKQLFQSGGMTAGADTPPAVIVPEKGADATE